MANKNNNSKNNNKKNNVIYIDRNNKTGKMSQRDSVKKKPTSNSSNKSNSSKTNSSKKPKSLKKGSSATSTKSKNVKSKQNINSKGTQKKTIEKTSKSKNISNKKSKIKWGRVAIAAVLVLVLGFGAFKGVQIIKNKGAKSQIANSESVDSGKNKDGATSSDGESVSKGQHDLDDENNSHDKKYNIVVDAGHGGKDKGSLDSTDTVYEKDISLQIAKKVASRLGREADVNVIMTRTEDKYISLEERAEIAKRANADALVSIHLNAQKKFGDANGLETWFRGGATDGSKELAASVQKTASSYVDIVNRGILRNNFEILRETTMPAILVECGFITNVNDMKKLKDPNFQDLLAEGIMQGTLSFLDNKNGKN